MQENRNDSELGLVVTSTRRDGRRRYDSQSKRRLAQACLQPGVSLAGMGGASNSWGCALQHIHLVQHSVGAIAETEPDSKMPVAANAALHTPRNWMLSSIGVSSFSVQ
jgi:transposase